MTLLTDLLALGLVNGAMFALLATAFGLVYRSARVFHIAFAGLLLLPPYVSYALATHFGISLMVAMLAGILSGAVFGVAAELFLYRPLLSRRSSPDAVMVASMGCYIILENSIALLFGNEVRAFTKPLAGRIELGPIVLLDTQAAQLLVSSTILILLAIALRKLPSLRALWAMGDEPDLMPVLGLNVTRLRLYIFALSGLLGGIGSCMVAYDVGVDPHGGMSYLLIAAVAVLAGGVDRFSGWIAGGLLLALLQSAVVWKLSSRWMDLATFALLTGILLMRPQGILGLKKRLEES